MHHIASVRAHADFSLDLRFDDGREAHLSLAEIVNTAQIAAPFRDPDRFVSELKLVEDGDVIRWDEQFELHADSLRYRAFPDELVRDYGKPTKRQSGCTLSAPAFPPLSDKKW